METEVSGFYASLKSSTLSWNEKILLCRYAWTHPEKIFLPNYRSLIIDHLSAALAVPKKSHLEAEDYEMVWKNYVEFLKFDFHLRPTQVDAVIEALRPIAVSAPLKEPVYLEAALECLTICLNSESDFDSAFWTDGFEQLWKILVSATSIGVHASTGRLSTSSREKLAVCASRIAKLLADVVPKQQSQKSVFSRFCSKILLNYIRTHKIMNEEHRVSYRKLFGEIFSHPDHRRQLSTAMLVPEKTNIGYVRTGIGLIIDNLRSNSDDEQLVDAIIEFIPTSLEALVDTATFSAELLLGYVRTFWQLSREIVTFGDRASAFRTLSKLLQLIRERSLYTPIADTEQVTLQWLESVADFILASESANERESEERLSCFEQLLMIEPVVPTKRIGPLLHYLHNTKTVSLSSVIAGRLVETFASTRQLIVFLQVFIDNVAVTRKRRDKQLFEFELTALAKSSTDLHPSQLQRICSVWSSMIDQILSSDGDGDDNHDQKGRSCLRILLTSRAVLFSAPKITGEYARQLLDIYEPWLQNVQQKPSSDCWPAVTELLSQMVARFYLTWLYFNSNQRNGARKFSRIFPKNAVGVPWRELIRRQIPEHDGDGSNDRESSATMNKSIMKFIRLSSGHDCGNASEQLGVDCPIEFCMIKEFWQNFFVHFSLFHRCFDHATRVELAKFIFVEIVENTDGNSQLSKFFSDRLPELLVDGRDSDWLVGGFLDALVDVFDDTFGTNKILGDRLRSLGLTLASGNDANALVQIIREYFTDTESYNFSSVHFDDDGATVQKLERAMSLVKSSIPDVCYPIVSKLSLCGYFLLITDFMASVSRRLRRQKRRSSTSGKNQKLLITSALTMPIGLLNRLLDVPIDDTIVEFLYQLGDRFGLVLQNILNISARFAGDDKRMVDVVLSRLVKLAPEFATSSDRRARFLVWLTVMIDQIDNEVDWNDDRGLNLVQSIGASLVRLCKSDNKQIPEELAAGLRIRVEKLLDRSKESTEVLLDCLPAFAALLKVQARTNIDCGISISTLPEMMTSICGEKNTNADQFISAADFLLTAVIEHKYNDRADAVLQFVARGPMNCSTLNSAHVMLLVEKLLQICLTSSSLDRVFAAGMTSTRSCQWRLRLLNAAAKCLEATGVDPKLAQWFHRWLIRVQAALPIMLQNESLDVPSVSICVLELFTSLLLNRNLKMQKLPSVSVTLNCLSFVNWKELGAADPTTFSDLFCGVLQFLQMCLKKCPHAAVTFAAHWLAIVRRMQSTLLGVASKMPESASYLLCQLCRFYKFLNSSMNLEKILGFIIYDFVDASSTLNEAQMAIIKPGICQLISLCDTSTIDMIIAPMTDDSKYKCRLLLDSYKKIYKYRGDV